MMSLLLFVLGVAVGTTIASHSRPKPIVLDTALQDRLAIAENLNVSLRQDLNEAKEKIWKLKNENIS
jgi:hypothetical protein